MLRRQCALVLTVALGLCGFFRAPATRADVAPLVSGDETIVVTSHQVKTVNGVLKYEARAGRLPIRNDESGEVRGYIFFVAYVQKAEAPKKDKK